MNVKQLIRQLKKYDPDALALQGAEDMTVRRWIEMLSQYEGEREVFTNIGVEREIVTYPLVLVQGWKPQGLFKPARGAVMFGRK